MAKKIKLVRGIFSNQPLLAVVVALFAGVGTYALVSSHAATSYFGYARVHVITTNVQGQYVGDAVGVGVHMDRPGSSYHCTTYNGSQPSGSTDYGITTSNGSNYGVYFVCGEDSTSYIHIYVDPPDQYISQDIMHVIPSSYSSTNPEPINIAIVQKATINSFSATPAQIYPGQSSQLSWSANAQSCSMHAGYGTQGGVIGTSGTLTIGTNSSTSPGTYSYQIDCSAWWGPATASAIASFTVVAPPTSTGGGSTTGGSTGGGGTSSGSTGGSTGSTGSTSGTTTKPKPSGTKPKPSGTQVADSAAPSAPNGLIASQNDSATVELSWGAASDNVGVTSYSVSRSTDNKSWASLADGISDTSYSDTSIDFNAHYYYQVVAHDAAGNTSPPAVADLTTKGFTSNITAADGGAVQSDDGIVEMKISAGTFDDDASCAVVNNDTSSPATDGLKLVAGEYKLSCKNSKGDDITTMNDPVDVTMNLKSFKNYDSFKAYGSSDNVLSLISSAYDAQSKKLNFQLTDFTPVSAYGAKKGGGTWVFFIVPLLIVLFFAAVIAWIRSRGGGPDGTIYDTGAYTLPMDGVVGGAGPTFTPGGPEQHASLPDLVAQDLRQGQATGMPEQYPLPSEQPPYVPPQPPLPPQPPAGPEQPQ